MTQRVFRRSTLTAFKAIRALLKSTGGDNLLHKSAYLHPLQTVRLRALTQATTRPTVEHQSSLKVIHTAMAYTAFPFR